MISHDTSTELVMFHDFLGDSCNIKILNGCYAFELQVAGGGRGLELSVLKGEFLDLLRIWFDP